MLDFLPPTLKKYKITQKEESVKSISLESVDISGFFKFHLFFSLVPGKWHSEFCSLSSSQCWRMSAMLIFGAAETSSVASLVR